MQAKIAWRCLDGIGAVVKNSTHPCSSQTTRNGLDVCVTKNLGGALTLRQARQTRGGWVSILDHSRSTSRRHSCQREAASSQRFMVSETASKVRPTWILAALADIRGIIFPISEPNMRCP